jgi:hypothetical protein
MAMYYESITKRQAGVIFSANKQGKINFSDTAIKYLYRNFVEVRGINNNHSQQDVYDRVKKTVDLIFANDYEEAQKELMSAFKLECSLFGGKEIEELKKAI